MAPIDVMLGNKKIARLPVNLLIIETEDDKNQYSPPLSPGVYFQVDFGRLDESEAAEVVESDEGPDIIIPAKSVGKVRAEEIDRVIYPSGLKRRVENVLRTKRYGSLIEPFIITE